MSEKNEWRDQIMEIITSVWDREIQIDHATDEIMELLSPTSSAPGDAQDERQAFVTWLTGSYPNTYSEPEAIRLWQLEHVSALAWKARAALEAPAAGDALDLTPAQKYEDACIFANANARDAARYRWLRDPQSDPALVLDKRTGYVPEDESVRGVGGYYTYEYRAGEELDAAIDAALAAQVPQQGEA